LVKKVLGNRYEVLERIGGGGMADVYRGRCTYLNRPVAIKILKSEFAEDDEFVRRFRREAQAAARLSHPNIVPIYDVGEEDGTHYIVMECGAGKTLKEEIRSRGRLDPGFAVAAAMQICEALRHAHGHQVIHRDIKPHNILLAGDGSTKVTDFGIARAAGTGTVTYTGTMVGSVHYFSPEQARGEAVGARSDLYSLGVVLYEMVTGRVPFTGPNEVTIAMKHIDEDPVPPSRLNPEVPEELEGVILRAMAKDPEDRYESAEEMLDDLESVYEELARRRPGMRPVSEILGLNRTNGARKKSERRRGAVSTKMNSRRKSPGRVRLLRVALWVIFLAALGALGAYGVQSFSDWVTVPTVEVPDVVGMSLVEAQGTLREAGLDGIVVAQRYSPESEANDVLAQSPEAGETVKRGRQVELTVSRGRKLVEGGVPNVVNLHVVEAKTRLQNVGLTLGHITRTYHESVPRDYVLSQNPRAGTNLAEGTPVDLEVSNGLPPLTMPDLKGTTLEEARTRLEDLELIEGIVTYRESDGEAGVVIEQSPPAGDRVAPGAIVDLVVSKEKEPETTATRLPITVPRSGVLKVEVTDAAGPKTIYEGRHQAGDQFEVPVEWIGESALLRVYVDGEVVAERVLR